MSLQTKPKTLTIEVTQEDIDVANVACEFGKPSNNCPIAQALKRIGKPAAVSMFSVYLDGKLLYLPNSARGFIQKFDDGCPVEPFTFEIE